MCGIAGYLGTRPVGRDAIQRTLESMHNRGPDSKGQATYTAGDVTCQLLFSRLAIIDLDPRSNQPFTFGNHTIVFNGEIYNYRELRAMLTRGGSRFQTESDTEVLVQLFAKYGDACLDMLEGMWAFALYDRNTGCLRLGRDRFGEKPLYLYRDAHGVYFGSEVKFLQQLTRSKLETNLQQLRRYLVYGYKSLYKREETFFNGVTELPPRTLLTIDPAGRETTHTYWTPRFDPVAMSSEDAVAGVKECLHESMRLRLRSDVPLAFCLSGGVDSSALVSIAAKEFATSVATYSIIDPDPRYNELDNIEATVRDVGSTHTNFPLRRESDLTRLRDLVGYHDAPIYTLSYYIHAKISERIAADGKRVVFSGTAADELFTGYYDHHNMFLYETRNEPEYEQSHRDWREHTGKFVRNPFLSDPHLFERDANFRGHIRLNSEEFSDYLYEPFNEPFVEEQYCTDLLRNRMMNEVFHEATRVILHEDDLNSMRFSLENRSPFLDRKLFEFAYRIPTKLLIQEGLGKYILRSALKGTLNDAVRLDRRKKGFNAAIQSVFDLKNPTVIEELLADGPIFDVLKREKIERLLLSDDTLVNSYSKFLFSFINAKFFLEAQSGLELV